MGWTTLKTDVDINKPCEAIYYGAWRKCLHVFHKEGIYGVYVEYNGSIIHEWVSRDRIRSICEPKYEPHTMETLLPLAKEFVYFNQDESPVWIISEIGTLGVMIDGAVAPYPLLMNYRWATGPNKGKPVAREV